jgi:hypothetical protein
MISLDLLNELKKTLDKYSSKQNSIIKLVINELFLINMENVNQEKSSIKIDNDIFELYLYSNFDNPFIYIYIENLSVEIQVGYGAQFLEPSDLIENDDLHKFKNVLKDLFYSTFQELLIYKGDKVISAKYKVNIEDIKLDFNFSIHYFVGLSDFFKRKRVAEQTLSSWIKL